MADSAGPHTGYTIASQDLVQVDIQTTAQGPKAVVKGGAYRLNTILQSINGRLSELEADVASLQDRIAALEAGSASKATAASGASWLGLQFIVASGATGTTVGAMLVAPAAGSVTQCKLVTKASDGATSLTFIIKQNGISVFAAPNTVANGTAPATVSTFANLAPSPLSIAADDVFTLDITSGSSSWQFTVQLE